MVKFFLENGKFNYTLFLFVTILGILSYATLPKEKFPIMDLDRVLISGGYAKTSNELLDKIAVSEIEKEIQGIEGVSTVNSVIANGSFSISLEIESGVDKSQVADKLRDAVSIASKNFPSDMNIPTVTEIQRLSEVIKVGVTSSEIEETLYRVDEVRDKLLAISGVGTVSVTGEREEFLKITIDPKKIELFGLSIPQVVSAIQNLSHIYPLGKVEAQGYHFFLLSESGKGIESATLKFGEKVISLSDVAKVEKKFEDDAQISAVNLHEAVIFEINKFEDENALRVAENVKEFVKNWDDSELKLFHFLDDSVSIRNRLNNVVSNILFGMILVFFAIYILISPRMAVVVTVGVPTSFFIAFIFLFLAGFSLNLISLLGLLIALGILVDDAIIVSENIQRHLENGESPMEASRKGALEVITPVTMASLTTVFTFLPLLFMSGHAGNFIMMIPITVSILVLASYLESFIFLPIHSKHILKRRASVKSWSGVKKVYRKVLEFHINWRKTFLITFIIGIPVAMVLLMKATKFQFFPKVDIPILYISGKVDESSTLRETEKKVEEVSKIVWENREKWGIANISSVTGFRRTAVGERENGENLFYIYLELHEQVPQNFVERYITPYLSFEYDNSSKIREKANREILAEISKELEKVEAEEISVFTKRIGVKVDVEIGVIAKSTAEILNSISTLESEISKIEGVTSISSNAYLGVDEVILKINPYGKMLGITEKDIANAISNLYLSNQKGNVVGERELLEVVVESSDLDNVNALGSLEILLENGTSVRITDVTDFELKRNLESIDKYDFKQMKSLFVNVDTKIITADEVLHKLEETFKSLEKQGIEFDFLGEKKMKNDLQNDLGNASILALSLIFISLILVFKSFGASLLVISVIPFSLLGVLGGHLIMDLNLTMPGIIGAFGLAGVVINDSIVMLTFLQKAKNREEILENASQRFRPIVLTSLTTLIGLSTIIFFITGQGLILQPIAVSLGFGLAWGTVLNLLYLPVMYSLIRKDNSYQNMGVTT
jgi:multidrug efflux pump subunit AcrB